MRCSHTLGSSKKELLSKIKAIAKSKVKELQIEIEVDDYILADVIQRWCEEVKKVETVSKNIEFVSSFRVAGFLTFWIRKLKPFYIARYNEDNLQKQIYINEILALVIGLILLYGLSSKKKKINDGAFVRLLTSLRYNSMSPMSVSLIYEYLYE